MTSLTAVCPVCGAPLYGSNCPRCRYRVRPAGDVVFSGGGAVGGVPSQVLVPISGRQQTTIIENNATLTDIPSAGGAADLSDSNDSTADGSIMDLLGNGEITSEIKWTVTSALAGSYSLVTVTIRASWQTGTAKAAKSVRPVIGSGAGTAVTITTTPTDYTFQFSVDPNDGLPWTGAKINSYKWGYEHIATTTGADNFEIATYEMSVRIDP